MAQCLHIHVIHKYVMKEIDRSMKICLLYARLSLTGTINFISQQIRIAIPVSVTSLTPASPYIVYIQIDFNFSQVLPTKQKIRQDLLGLSDPSFMRNRREERSKFNRKNYTRAIQRIGETETSSPATLYADSKSIADWYTKIAGLIIPLEALKKGRHASHVCQQGTI